jgi:phosphohistidine phosphatase SixA
MKKLLILLSLIFVFAQMVVAQKTEVWIIRHAEKETSDPQNTNPDLSAEGQERAQKLVKLMADIKLDKAFSTPYKRTRQTLAPLVKAKGIELVDYSDVAQLAKQIRKEYSGKKIIIAGHSNTILEIVEAFGIARPVATIGEKEFNNILHITLEADLMALDMNTYGDIM